MPKKRMPRARWGTSKKGARNIATKKDIGKTCGERSVFGMLLFFLFKRQWFSSCMMCGYGLDVFDVEKKGLCETNYMLCWGLELC